MTHNQQKSEEKGKALLDERAALMAKVHKARELRNRNNAPPEEDGVDEASPLNDKKRRGRTASRGYLPGASASGSSTGGSSIRKKDQAG
jgi:hypothetical protein